MPYVFVSFGSAHTRKPLGGCVVEVDNSIDANKKCMELGLMPDECNKAFGYPLDTNDPVAEIGLEPNRFYSADELEKTGMFVKASEVKKTT